MAADFSEYKNVLMRLNYFLTWFALFFCPPVYCQVDMGYWLEETAGGTSWTLVYQAGKPYGLDNTGYWNSQVVTLRWPDSLGGAVVEGIQNLAAFDFQPDTGPEPGGDGHYYLKLTASAYPVVQALHPDTLLPVLRLSLGLPPSLARAVDFAPSAGAWNAGHFGRPDVEHATDGNSFHLFRPTVHRASPPTCGNPTAGLIVVAADTSVQLEYSVDSGLTFQAGPVFSGLPAGDYHLAIRKADDPALLSFALENPVQLATPVFPELSAPSVSQPTCAVPTGQVDLTAVGSGPMDYSMDNGVSWQSSGLFPALPPGTWIPAVRLRSDTSCLVSRPQLPVMLAPPLPLPAISAVTLVQPTCAVPSGTISVDASGGSPLAYSLSGGDTWTADSLFAGLPPGSYELMVRLTADTTCLVAYAGGSLPVHAVPVPPAVSQPDIIQPVCALPTGSVTVQASGAGDLEYSLNNGDNWQADPSFSGLPPAQYPVSVRLSADTTCLTAYAGPPVEVVPPAVPPVIGQVSVVQPTCAVPSGEITVSAVGSSSLQYSLDNGTSWAAGAGFSGLPPGLFSVLVRLSEDLTCVSSFAGNPVTVEAIPSPPVVTDVSVVQPNCTSTLGSALVSADGSGPLAYRVHPAAPWQSVAFFPSLSPAAYAPAVRLSADTTCVGLYPAGFLINPPPTPPIIQDVSVVQPTDCSQPTGQVTVLAAAAGSALEYQLLPGTGAWQAASSFPTALPGSWEARVRLADDPACVVAYPANPVVVEAPAACCAVPSYVQACLSGDYISKFRFGGFENNSDACDQPGMGNYLAMNEGPSVVLGSSYLVQVSVSPTRSQFVGMYLDLDQNGSFLDAGEFYNFGYVPAGFTIQASYTIPYSAKSGWSKIRVRSRRGQSLTAADGCETIFYFGETEDYPIHIACPAVTYVNGSPIPDNTYVASSSVYADGQVSAGQSLTLRAGSDVTLQSGFELPPTATLEVLIQGCDD